MSLAVTDWTNGVGLITQRSLVQIQPPPPSKVKVRDLSNFFEFLVSFATVATQRVRVSNAAERKDVGGMSEGRLVVTVTEAAELLGISRGLAYELARAGQLPSLRLGRRLVVPRAALLEWLERAPRPEIWPARKEQW